MAKFVVYEKVAEAIWKRIDKSTASASTATTVNLGSGLIAGFAAAIISQPADTMLSKINKTKGLPGEGTTSRLIKIAQELGLRGSFSGIGARLFMVGTLTAGQFAIYGDIKKVRYLFLFIEIKMYSILTLISLRLLAQPVVSRSPSRCGREDGGAGVGMRGIWRRRIDSVEDDAQRGR